MKTIGFIKMKARFCIAAVICCFAISGCEDTPTEECIKNRKASERNLTTSICIDGLVFITYSRGGITQVIGKDGKPLACGE